jgi:hypothetical protein
MVIKIDTFLNVVLIYIFMMNLTSFYFQVSEDSLGYNLPGLSPKAVTPSDVQGRG